MGREAFDLTIRFSIQQQKKIHILAALDGVPPSTWARAIIEATITEDWPGVLPRLQKIEQMDQVEEIEGEAFVASMLNREKT